MFRKTATYCYLYLFFPPVREGGEMVIVREGRQRNVREKINRKKKKKKLGDEWSNCQLCKLRMAYLEVVWYGYVSQFTFYFVHSS